MGQTYPTEIIVDPDIAKVNAALKSITDAQAAAGAVVRVRDGSFTQGQSAGTGAAPTGDPNSATPGGLNLGKASWNRNVLICPLNGYGRVDFGGAAGHLIKNANRISLFGFKHSQALNIQDSFDVELGFCKIEQWQVTGTGANIYFYEVLSGYARPSDNGDVGGIRPRSDAPGTIVNVYRYGCVSGPSIKISGSGAHSDTLQFERSNIKGRPANPTRYGDLYMYDCADFASSNAVFLNANDHTEWHHCLGVGGRSAYVVMPRLQNRPGGGSDYDWDNSEPYAPNMHSGNGGDKRAYDSIFIGSAGPGGWTHVSNSKISSAVQAVQRPTVSGAWTVDATLANKTEAQYYAYMDGNPESETYQKSCWEWML